MGGAGISVQTAARVSSMRSSAQWREFMVGTKISGLTGEGVLGSKTR